MKNLLLNCQKGTNKIQTIDGTFTLYEILRKQNIVYPMIEELGESKWIPFKNTLCLCSSLGKTEVNSIWFNGKKKVYEIVFDDKSIYHFTFDHSLMYENKFKRRWKNLKDLSYGDEILTVDCSKEKRSFSRLKIRSINYLGVVPTWDFNVDCNYYILGNGVVAHDGTIVKPEKKGRL